MTRSSLTLLCAVCAGAASLCAPPASADALLASTDDGPHNNTLRIGSFSIFYHTTTDQGLQGAYVPAGVAFKSKDLETLYIGYVRRLSPYFDLELALGYPPQSKVEGRGPATVGSVPYAGQTISSARWISPTLFLNYQLLGESHPWRPFVGVGVNYTTFYDRDTTAAGDAATGGPTRLSLTSSVGPAATAGVVYKPSNRWSFDASYSISRVNSTLTTDTDGVMRTARIRFGPQALVVAGGYSF